MRLYQSIVFVLAILGVCVGAASASEGQQHPKSILNQSPYTYLLDTGTQSPIALSERELARKTGWTKVAEDNLRHKFTGDTVFLNDNITVVLRHSGSGAEVYSKTADGLKQRAQIFACAGGAPLLSYPPPPHVFLPKTRVGGDAGAGESKKGGTTRLSSVRIIENNPAAVMLEAVFQTQQGRDVSATYRLTTGQIYLEISPGKGMNSLFIRTNTRHVVVPDFFGDDVVFSPESFEGPRISLPAENFLLHMLEGNDAIVMCVWESDKLNAEAISEAKHPCLAKRREPPHPAPVSSERGQRRVINGCNIQCIEDKRIWVAFMEGSDIWYERLISDEDKGRDIVLDWEPPFPAKWRAAFIKRDELAESWNFRDEQEPDFVSPATGELVCSCWFDGGRPYVRVPKLWTMVGAGPCACPGQPHRVAPTKEGGHAWPVIVYPIDRSRATPLRFFCPVDIVRNTLGVGPCQYILQKEGFGSESHSTPDEVTRWVENLFKKKKEKHASVQIEEHFKQMVEHMRQTQTRIKQYGDFARQLRKLSEKEKSNKAVADALGRLLGIVDEMEQSIVIRSNSAKPSESSARLAEKIIALIGKDGALARCQKLGSQIRVIAAAQDRALSKCRMAVRRIKQQCMTVADKEPQAADFAGKVQDLAEQMLHRK